MAIFNLLLIACAVISVSGLPSCCPPGYVLLSSKNDPSPQCWKLDNQTDLILGCRNTVKIVKSKNLNFEVNEGGQLVLLLPNREVIYEAGSFCQDFEATATKNGRPLVQRVALICDEQPTRMVGETVYGYCMLVSTIFLILTAGVYSTRHGWRDLHGKSIINLCVSLAFGLGLLVVMKLVPYSDMNLCAARGFFAYFFVLVSFFWMNAISIQMVRSVRNHQTQESQKLLWYAVYAWCVPAALAIAMAVINFMPGDHLKPGIGLNHCWFFDIRQQWVYMYSVMSVLTIVNLHIFVNTMISVCCRGVDIKKFKNKLIKCLQLFVVMGVPWVFEMAGSLSPPHPIWECLDLFNSLQGVWIFLVLVVLPRRQDEQEEEEPSQYNKNIVTCEQPYYKL